MSLMLSVPNLSARNSDEVELQPQKIKKWLEDLPLLNVEETSRKLFSVLSVHNRIDFEDNLRLQLLELFRNPVIQISRELSKQYIGSPLPLSNKHETIAEQNHQFLMEMANGYKRLALNMADAGTHSNNQALIIHRSIRYLSSVLVACYQTYSSYPQDTWKEIHALYTHAEKLGIVQNEVDDPLNKAVEKSSVMHVYLQALLLGLCDPYHLPPRMIDRTNHYLDRWAPLALLTEVSATYNPTCQFLIDQESDRAGIAYAANTVTNRLRGYRLLNTVELARQMHAQLTLLMNGDTPPPDGLYEKFFRDTGHESTQDLLKRLLNTWGVNPHRSFRRNLPTSHQVEMATGLDNVNYWINDGKKFIVSSTFVGPMPKRTLIGTEQIKPKYARLPDREFSTWDVEDESAGGLSLSSSDQTRLHVQIGDIIVTRVPGKGNPWRVGVIRWLKSAGTSNVKVGIQQLAPSAEPVVIKTLTDDMKESDFLPALLLPEIKSIKQPQTIITQSGVYKPGTEIYMDNSYWLYKIAPTALIEANHSFEQFRFDILNT
ncbi:MAG: hypothetical protein ACYC9L_02085 [Sulfuricaulis sp.]